MWLAANAPELVTASVIEDAPFFRAEWPAIKNSVVYDVFLGSLRTAIPGSGGFPKFFLDTLAPMAQETRHHGRHDSSAQAGSAARCRLDEATSNAATRHSHRPPISPDPNAVFLRSFSHFDGNFSRAFVDGTVGAGFDHATALAQSHNRCCPSRKLVYVRRPHRRRTHRRRRRACEVTRHRGIRLRSAASGHFIPLEKT